MLRTTAVILTLIAALAAPTFTPAPALACGIVRVPTDTKAELAAIRKALAQKKLDADVKAKAQKLLADAEAKSVSKPDREKAIAEAMKLLDLRRIFRDQACITRKVPALVS
jgi:uncharacterized membrane protein